MDISEKAWNERGGQIFFEFLTSLSADELKELGALHIYILGDVIPKVFREAFKMGSKYTAMQLCGSLRKGSEN